MVWTHLQPQVIEHIHDLRAQGYTFGEMQDALMNRYNWYNHPIFEKAAFNYEHAEFTLMALCNMVELITGSDTEFVDELREDIIGQVEHEREVHRREQREDLHREDTKAQMREKMANVYLVG